jgi:hypothetical protein
MSRRALATMLVFLLAGPHLLGQTASLGVVTQSSGGRLNTAVTSVGTTIYNGDRLSTGDNGILGARFGSVQLLLSGDSAIFVGQDGPLMTPALQRGSVAFTVESAGSFLLSAADVRVRPQTSDLTVGQVTLEECAVVVTSRSKALEVTAGKETKIVETGQSYRVVLNTGCGKHPNQFPVAAAHSRFILIPIIVSIITIPPVQEVFESPDRP